MIFLKRIKVLSLFSKAFKEFKLNDPLRMAGATAFFTTFALPAVLIILIQVFGLVLSPRFMTTQLFLNLGDVVGKHTAIELRKTLSNVRHLFKNWYQAVLGFLFLIFVATTLLKVIKDSLNQLWNIRMGENLSIKLSLINRLKSFLVILIAGILFLVVLLTEGAMDLIQHSTNNPTLIHGTPGRALLMQIVSLTLVTIWFSLLFKFIADGRPSWKTVFVGAAFTGFLFTIGKLLLQWLLSYNSMQSVYGASTSSVLLLLFVFYSSFIFYYGACFTKVWAESNLTPIQAANYAEKFELRKLNNKKRSGL